MNKKIENSEIIVLLLLIIIVMLGFIIYYNYPHWKNEYETNKIKNEIINNIK